MQNWKPRFGEIFFAVQIYHERIFVDEICFTGNEDDEAMCASGNMYQFEQEAQAKADIIKEILGLNSEESRTSLLGRIGNAVTSEIITLLKSHDSEPDFCLGSTPVIQADECDDNNTYTLDSVEVDENGEDIVVDASNCWNSMSLRGENLSVERLCDILDFLKDNEDNIWESC